MPLTLTQPSTREWFATAPPPLQSWIEEIYRWMVSCPSQLQRVSYTNRAAAVSTTPIPTPTLTARNYRVSWYARISQAGTVSSSLQLTITWTEGGQAMSRTFTALTGNTVTTFDADTLPLRADAGTTINYAWAYASVGATAMTFNADVWLESMPTMARP